MVRFKAIGGEKLNPVEELEDLDNRWNDFCQLLQRTNQFFDDDLHSWFQINNYLNVGDKLNYNSTAYPSSFEEVQRQLTTSRLLAEKLADQRLRLLTSIRQFKYHKNSMTTVGSEDEKKFSSAVMIRKMDSIIVCLHTSDRESLQNIFEKLANSATKLTASIQVYERLQEQWQEYINERDSFKSWILEQSLNSLYKTGCDLDKNFLNEIHSQSVRLHKLFNIYGQLTQPNARLAPDVTLQHIELDYKNLLSRLKLQSVYNDKKLVSEKSDLENVKYSHINLEEISSRSQLNRPKETKSDYIAKGNIQSSSKNNKTARCRDQSLQIRFEHTSKSSTQQNHSTALERTNALQNLLQTVKHIKKDMQTAEAVAEKRRNDLSRESGICCKKLLESNFRKAIDTKQSSDHDVKKIPFTCNLFPTL